MSPAAAIGTSNGHTLPQTKRRPPGFDPIKSLKNIFSFHSLGGTRFPLWHSNVHQLPEMSPTRLSTCIPSPFPLPLSFIRPCIHALSTLQSRLPRARFRHWRFTFPLPQGSMFSYISGPWKSMCRRQLLLNLTLHFLTRVIWDLEGLILIRASCF